MPGEQAKNSICGYKMAKKDKVTFAPGELSRVRDKLGYLDAEEAKKMAQKLGGEVGYERTDEEEKARQSPHRTRHERVNVKIGDRPSQPGRRVDLAPEVEDDHSKKKFARPVGLNPADDPSIPIKVGYWERVKMDRLAGQPEFEIKSGGQVFYSMISLFTDITDSVNPAFVTRRMTEYYKKIEVLVISTRNIFPRNNMRRNERMKKTAPLAYSILDVIRYWDIEKISGDLARIQSHPKSAKVSEFADILRAVYRPLFILGKLDQDAHIRGAYKILYKLLYIESPIEAQNKFQELIRVALTAYSGILRDIRYLLYPLLLKFISPNFLPYDRIFIERRHRLLAFLNVSENNQIIPEALNVQVDDKEIKPGEAAPQAEETPEQGKAKEGQAPEQAQAQAPEKEAAQAAGQVKEEKISDEEREQRTAEEAEKKALERGLSILDTLFPKAGWERPSTYPDFYPYFVDIFDLKKGFVNIAPTDPLQQIFILMRSLEELFFGLRYVNFGSVPGSSGNMERVDSILTELINDWHYYIEASFVKEYLTRMAEYVRILEGSKEERSSPYTKKLITEMHHIKRFYFLPYYKFESLVPPSIQKKDTFPVYVKIKTLRKYLTAVAAGIELGTKAGGAQARAPCDGIENPWDPYVFQVPNPLSIRLDAILSPKTKTNASLIYFCLAITTVLDHLVNNEHSWAYNRRPEPLFRSVDGEGIIPLTGVDERVDADALFKQALRQRQKKTEAEE